MHHLASPAAHGLFQRAVVMSGGGRTYGIGGASERAEQAGVTFANSMGVTGTDADAFAKTCDPNGSGLSSWPRYDATKSELMIFTRDAAAVVQADPWKSRLDLIERAVEKQGALPQ